MRTKNPQFTWRVLGETVAGSLVIEMHSDHFQSLITSHLFEIGDIERLGETVRLWRKANGESQTEFAKRIGLSRNMLSLIEFGHRKNMTLATAVRLLKGMSRP